MCTTRLRALTTQLETCEDSCVQFAKNVLILLIGELAQRKCMVSFIDDELARNSAVAAKPRDALVQHAMAWLRPRKRNPSKYVLPCQIW